MALKTDRALLEKYCPHQPEWGHDVAQGFRVFRHGICVLLADGTVAPAGAANTPVAPVTVLGLAAEYRDATAGASGCPVIAGNHLRVVNGCFSVPFTETAPTWADYGKPVYAVDDEFVSLTETPEGGSSRIRAGKFAGFDIDGTAFVTIGQES